MFAVPVPDRDTQPFWDGCSRGELVVQQCGACGKWLWQPRPVCSSCQTPEPVWKRVSGNGRIASWTVMRPPTLPAYAEMVPFVVLLVELDERVRLLGYLVDLEQSPQNRRRGGRLARFHEQGFHLPCWTLDG
jgi:uncharacterized OB-fold protein